MGLLRKTVLACVVIMGASGAAHAAHWVQTRDTWLWIDTDSFKQDGDVTYYAESHSKQEAVPPDVGGGTKPLMSGAVDCKDGIVYSGDLKNSDAVFQNDAVPEFRWTKVEDSGLNTKFLARIVEIVCKR